MTERALNILFLCTGNSCRSQMAEGWGRELKGECYNFYSAGIETHGLNPNAVKVMQEVGIDISSHLSQTLDDLSEIVFDVVFTVCSHAHDNCPAPLKQSRVIHVGFDDPPKLAKNSRSEEEALTHYRRVRDEIKRFVSNIETSLS
ncbi:MAG: arsenate reductase ArsC [Gammaproteobacteria bacterium]|nr:arsenate reductase ArsC [Gammaproteobacteria bacterium]